MKAAFFGALLGSSAFCLLGVPAKAITYTFDNAQYEVGGGTFQIRGSFDFDGTTVTDFSSIQISRWRTGGAASQFPAQARYIPLSGGGDQLRFTDLNRQSNQLFVAQNLLLTGTAQTILLSGKVGLVQWCSNPGTNCPQTRSSRFRFTSGTLTAVPGPLSALALAPFGFVVSLRRRHGRIPNH